METQRPFYTSKFRTICQRLIGNLLLSLEGRRKVFMQVAFTPCTVCQWRYAGWTPKFQGSSAPLYIYADQCHMYPNFPNLTASTQDNLNKTIKEAALNRESVDSLSRLITFALRKLTTGKLQTWTHRGDLGCTVPLQHARLPRR